MVMKLTENHIDELYKFTRQHYVEHFDVQTELVDHLAIDIEQIWLEKPLLSFEEARTISFKKFGIFGFMDVIEAKQKAMTKKYWKILYFFVKEWFSYPKIIITLSIFALFVFLIKLKEAPFILIFCFVTLVIFEIVNGVIIGYKVKVRKKRNQRIFLLEEMIYKTKNGFIIILICNVFNIINAFKIDFSSLAIYWIVILAFSFTLLTISFYVTEFVMPQKAEELLQETYPEYKLVNNL